MVFSLYMLQDKWDLPGSRLIVRADKRQFFQSIRLLTDGGSLKEDTLYYVPSDLTGISGTLTDDPGSGFIFSQKPAAPDLKRLSGMDHAWVEQEQDLGWLRVFNHLLGIQELYGREDARLSDALYAKDPIQCLVDLLGEVTGNPAYVVDWSFRAVAMDWDPELPYISVHWKNLQERGYFSYQLVSSILQNEEWHAIRRLVRPAVVTSREFSTPFLIHNLRYRGKIQWHLISTELFTKITHGHEDLAELIGGMILEKLSSDPQYLTVEGGFHEHFFRDVISGDLKDTDVIAEQLAPLGWAVDGLYCVAETMGTGDQFYKKVSLYCKQMLGGMSLLYEGRALTVFPLAQAADLEAIRQKLSDLLQKYEGHGALSDPFHGFHDLENYVVQTAQALKIGMERSSSVRLFLYKDYTLHHMFSLCGEKMDLRTACHRALWALREDDLFSHGDQLHTLYAYLRHGRNLVQTAKALDIHRNTLVYRLKKIQESTALDLADADIRFDLLLGFEIMKYLGDFL